MNSQMLEWFKQAAPTTQLPPHGETATGFKRSEIERRREAVACRIAIPLSTGLFAMNATVRATQPCGDRERKEEKALVRQAATIRSEDRAIRKGDLDAECR